MFLSSRIYWLRAFYPVGRQGARPEVSFAAQPNEGVKVDVPFVVLRSVIIHQPSWSLGVAKKPVCSLSASRRQDARPVTRRFWLISRFQSTREPPLFGGF